MDSDSEEDSDYIPPKEYGDSGSEGRAPKRARTQGHQEAACTEDAGEHADTEHKVDAYATFKASLNAPPTEQSAQAPAPVQMVKITKRYKYAGEDIIEVKDVPAHSDEAKKWPLWKPSDDAANSLATSSTVSASASALVAGPSSSPEASSTSAAKPQGKRPAPRKPKSKFGEVPKKAPLKRLTTLDKSAMDWRAHVEAEPSSTMKDELEANRRGGGYLEKQEFLQRVETRKDEVLEAAKGKRRR